MEDTIMSDSDEMDEDELSSPAVLIPENPTTRPAATSPAELIPEYPATSPAATSPVVLIPENSATSPNKRKEINKSDISKNVNTARKAQKLNYVEMSSDEDYDDIFSDSAQSTTSPSQLLLLKKGGKLRDILLNLPHHINDDALTNSNELKSEVMKALVELSADQIKITNEKSAKERIQQWKSQEQQCEKLQISAESYNLMHLMSLVEVYEDIMKIGESLKSDPKNNVTNVKRWVIKFMCENLGITSKAEQRNRLGCERLHYLFNEGITCEQLAQAGCRKCDFFVSQKNYEIFFKQIPFFPSSESKESNEQDQVKSDKGKNKVIFKLRLGEDLADQYKEDEYIDV